MRKKSISLLALTGLFGVSSCDSGLSFPELSSMTSNRYDSNNNHKYSAFFVGEMDKDGNLDPERIYAIAMTTNFEALDMLVNQGPITPPNLKEERIKVFYTQRVLKMIDKHPSIKKELSFSKIFPSYVITSRQHSLFLRDPLALYRLPDSELTPFHPD